MNNKNYQWFIEPLDGYTNEAISRALAEIAMHGSISSEIDEKGKPHEVYLVEHIIIERFENSKRYFGFKFNSFNRLGSFGKIRGWKFPKKKKARKTVKAGKDLERITQKQ